MKTTYTPAGSFEENLGIHQDLLRLSSEQGIIKGHVNTMINRQGQIIKPLARLTKNTNWTINPSVKEVLDFWEKLVPGRVYILFGVTFDLINEESGAKSTSTRYTKFKRKYNKTYPGISYGGDWWFILGPDSSQLDSWQQEVERLKEELKTLLKKKGRRLVVC